MDKCLPTRLVRDEKRTLALDCWLGNLFHTGSSTTAPTSRNSGSCLQIRTSGRIHPFLFGTVNATVRFLEGQFCESYTCKSHRLRRDILEAFFNRLKTDLI